MQYDSMALIVALEVAAVSLILCFILFVRNRSLRSVVNKLQHRMGQLVQDLKKARATKTTPPADNVVEESSVIDHINEELEFTRQHHASLDPGRDIVLDLAPDTALPRRTAALRYAMLVAEKEAKAFVSGAEERTNWSALQAKYQQIFEFYADYPAEPETSGNEEAQASLHQQLLAAKKRIDALEKFKALYVELKDQWQESKEIAKNHYEDLSTLAAELENGDKFTQALDRYQAIYHEIDNIIRLGIGEHAAVTDEVRIINEETAAELEQLRMVAADQHQLIAELQTSLKNARSDDEREQIIASLENELERHQRFVQESETCIQLMEDELNNAHTALGQLRGKLKALPGIKRQVQQLRKQKDEYAAKVSALTAENHRLKQKLDDGNAFPFEDKGEAARLKEDLAELETRYANLEEKYLDLKIKE